VQVSVNVLLPNVCGDTLNEPLVACAPDHAPLAAQVAPLLDQVSVVFCPCAMVTGVAEIVTVAGDDPEVSAPP
jgi:hypothetical protein